MSCLDYFWLLWVFHIRRISVSGTFILATETALASLPTDLKCTNGSLPFQYKYESLTDSNYYHLSPKTSYLWDWSVPYQFIGTYKSTADNGQSFSLINCNGSDEQPQWGIGCSNGPGATPKVLPYYSNDEQNGISTICSDTQPLCDEACCDAYIYIEISCCLGCQEGYYDDGADCYNMGANDSIFACRGTWTGGITGTEAKSICGDNFHIWYVVCVRAFTLLYQHHQLTYFLYLHVMMNSTSEIEASNLGLNANNCGTMIDSDEIFLSLESSAGNGDCNSEYGTTGKNDIWGCASSISNFTSSCWPDTCGVFPYSCGNTNTTNIITFDDANTGEYRELDTVSFYNAQYGGVLCCRDDDGTNDACEGCQEGYYDGGVDCYNMNANDNIFACRGTWTSSTGGMIGTEAEAICADNFHIWYVLYKPHHICTTHMTQHKTQHMCTFSNVNNLII